jgi:hypothetical protein
MQESTKHALRERARNSEISLLKMQIKNVNLSRNNCLSRINCAQAALFWGSWLTILEDELVTRKPRISISTTIKPLKPIPAITDRAAKRLA